MAWVRIDDGVPHHPKFLQAGPAAAWLWVCAVAYSQRQLTDGFVPRAAVPTLGVPHARKLLERLVEVGLMDVNEFGWQVHDYLDHNDSRDVAMAKRAAITAARSEAGRKGGLAKQTPSKQQANSKQTGEAPSYPIPDVRSSTSSQNGPKSHPVREFLALHERLFVESFSQKPSKYTKADAKIAHDAIADRGESEARRLLETFFASADPFIRQSGYGLNVFRGQVNKLLTSSGPVAVERPDVRGHLPACRTMTECNEKLAAEIEARKAAAAS